MDRQFLARCSRRASAVQPPGYGRRSRRPTLAITTSATPTSGQSPKRAAHQANGVIPVRPSTTASSAPLREAWPAGDDAAAVVDRDRRAGVGGADHRQLEFERAHARDLQVLVDRDRVAEPADVAHVGEDRRGLRGVDETRRELFAEQVFVADVRRDSLAVETRTMLSPTGPRSKSPSGMFISCVNQWNPVGTNSPNGTKWCLS